MTGLRRTIVLALVGAGLIPSSAASAPVLTKPEAREASRNWLAHHQLFGAHPENVSLDGCRRRSVFKIGCEAEFELPSSPNYPPAFCSITLVWRDAGNGLTLLHRRDLSVGCIA